MCSATTSTRQISLFIFACLFAVPSVCGGSLDLEDAVSAVAPTVVHIVVPITPKVADSARSDERNSGGSHPPMPNQVYRSGVIIDSEGYFISLAHIVGKLDPILVRLNDGRELTAELVGKDQRSDVALLKINASDLSVPLLGNSAKLPLGARVFAMGALVVGGQVTVVDGIVSVNESRPYPALSFIQTTASIGPGMVGGPLFDESGRLIGINALLYSKTSNEKILSFAIPIDYVKAIAEELRARHSSVK